MPVRNAHWYNQNEGRAYPVDDAATCDDDRGRRLPPDLLADLNLRWPATLGRYAFVAAVANTPALVTLTVQAADAPDAASGFVPLAVVSVRKPVQPGRMVALRPQAPGVAGWVVFGSGVDGEAYSGRFSTPAQSRLTARAARAYRPLPVTSVQARNAADRLTGVVTLKASEPLTVAKEERFLDGAMRDAIVVRLVDSEGAEGFPVPQDAADITGYRAASVFQQFAGPCAGRPESNTCGCPNPIEYINAVAPDCNGLITIEFNGCAQVAEVIDVPGIAVTCQFGLVDACLPPQLPTSEGLLPSEFEPANIPVPPDVPPSPPPPGTSDTPVPDVNLPYVACFVNGLSDLGTAVGEWVFSGLNSPTAVCAPQVTPFPVSESLSASASVSVSTSLIVGNDGSYQAATAASRCVALFDVDVTTVYRKATTEVMLAQGPTGAKRNAQLVVNYRPHTSIAGQFVYFAAEVDYDTQTFRLLRFNGTRFTTVAPASVTTPGIQLDKWYRIEAECLPGPTPGDVTIAIRLQSISDPGIDVSLSATVSNYQPSSGKFGVGTNRAISNFAYLKIEEAP
jgi:hypothetical protein